MKVLGVYVVDKSKRRTDRSQRGWFVLEREASGGPPLAAHIFIRGNRKSDVGDTQDHFAAAPPTPSRPAPSSSAVVEPAQTIHIEIRWDHGVTDPAPIARVLTRLEQVLNAEIAAELWAAGAEPVPAVRT